MQTKTITGVERSPLHPANLLDLFFRPGEFFSNMARLDRDVAVILAVLAMGLAGSIGQIENKLFATDAAGHMPKAWAQLIPVQYSWGQYWMMALFTGIIGAGFMWVVGGWWYRKRLQWSGASGAPPRSARLVYVYQELVNAAPVLLIALAQTALYRNYREALNATGSWVAFLAVLFSFWACWASYKGATTAFLTEQWKALLWFVIVPAGIRIFGSIGIVTALTNSGHIRH